MTVYEMKVEILRSLGLPISGDTDLTDSVILQYLKDAHNQLAEDSFCYRRQVIVPTIKSSKRTIVCTFGSAPSDGQTFIVGSTTYTWKDSVLTGTNSVLIGTGTEYIKNMADAINGIGGGTTCNENIVAYQTFVATYADTVITLTGITYDTSYNTITVTGTVVSTAICIVTTPTNGADGLRYSIPDDVIHIARITYGNYELYSTKINRDEIFDGVPTCYDRYSIDKIILNGRDTGRYPLVLDCHVIPNTTINIYPTLTVATTTPAVVIASTDTATPASIPEMFHKILVYLVTARVMTEMFADTIDGAQIRIQTALNMANLLTNKFKAGLMTW